LPEKAQAEHTSTGASAGNLTPQEFNRRMKYAFLNDDPQGVLGQIYDDDLPHPYFDPAKIGFDKLRNFDHHAFTVREDSDRIMVYEDLEFILPDNSDYWSSFGTGVKPMRETDKLITSTITDRDHLWGCETAFNSWHLVQTHKQNKETFVKQKDTRPYIADILLGNPRDDLAKHIPNMRPQFFEMLREANLLDTNLINLFGHYKSPFIDEGTGEIDLFFKQLQGGQTTKFFKGQFASQFISNHIAENTWVSVVCETIIDGRMFFPTEKTGKAMMSGKPFIVLSSPRFLQHLRELGFKTFSPVIDETYDQIENPVQRCKAAFNSFQALHKMDQIKVRESLLDVIQHNEKCMRDFDFLTYRARNLLDPLTTKV